MEKIVIVGGVAAGATAAAKLRRISSEAQIVMLEAGADISFANCGLPYYIGGDIKSRSKLILHSPESFKEQYNVDVYIHTLVHSIDREAHAVQSIDTHSGETKTFEYTKLFLAQGVHPIKPAIENADMQHVFSLWTLHDMDKISYFMDEKKPKTAVVVGGGFIGLEMAEALSKRGLKVSVVETTPHVMGVMDAEIAGFLENEMLSYGVELHTSTSVTRITSKNVELADGNQLDADMVLFATGVCPNLKLAKESGLQVGDAGGLLVNEYLQTSDPDIYAAGDMVEIKNRIIGENVRIPLAGPANRQGRIAAENILGGKHKYPGAIGTSIVRLFKAVAGITGLSLKQALKLGINADAIVVHKEHHTSYYPGAEQVSVLIVYNKETGIVLGGQSCGYKGVDRRLDIIATAAASKLTVSNLADIDFAYSPPLGTANDAINIAAFVAENKMSGYSPSINTSELDAFVETNFPLIIDVQDVFAFEKSHIDGAVNIPIEFISSQLNSLPKDRTILVYDENGKKGHRALRVLIGAGFNNVYNISGGHTSLQRYERAVGFKSIKIKSLSIESEFKNVNENKEEIKDKKTRIDFNAPVVVDVRTPEEFLSGAYPGAINIPLDELTSQYEERIGTNLDLEITVYCASGARSAYAQRFLREKGYVNVKNGGGLTHMLMKRGN